jgi:hypothetical protein
MPPGLRKGLEKTDVEDEALSSSDVWHRNYNAVPKSKTLLPNFFGNSVK